MTVDRKVHYDLELETGELETGDWLLKANSYSFLTTCPNSSLWTR